MRAEDTGGKAAANAPAADHAAWKAVPSNLMALEKDPAKAASDPGYYGREYSFVGDVAIENQKFTALFNSASGKLALLTPAAKKIAADHAQNRLVSIMEGGYNLEGLGKGAAAHVKALME